MKDRIRTLILHASGVPRWKRITLDTSFELLGLRPERVPARLRRGMLRRILEGGYVKTSYVVDWLEAFCSSPDLDAHPCNINNLIALRRELQRIAEYELVVLLHSVASDDLTHIRRTIPALCRRRGKLLVLFGNEYNLMAEKIRFVQQVQAEYIGSQLPIESARWLYEECSSATVLSAPHALNPKHYYPLPGPRPVDIGFRGDLYPLSLALGDNERNHIIQYFHQHAAELGLVADIQFARFPREHWRAFLNHCKATIGAESGTSYLERDDRTRSAVQAYLAQHPSATFNEIFDRFFRAYPNPVSGKAISSRHFEPIGTKTCQILIEGHFNGILQPDVHYIAVRSDLSNIRDAVDRLKDDDFRSAMVERTYQYAMEQHTYAHRVADLVRAIDSNVARPAAMGSAMRVER